MNTAGFISGYRGSPARWIRPDADAGQKHLAKQNIVFQPGVNEELAATAVWGSQQLDLFPEKNKHDGVFGMWYGKGPGVDRCIDVFKHANMAGTAKHGGVIAIAGDDHIAKSSTAAHQSDHVFKAVGFPVFFPTSVQDILDMGLHAFALSRFFRRLVGPEDDPGDRRIGGFGQRGSGPRQHHPAGRLPDACGRPAHPLARCAAGAGSAADGLQVVRRAGLHPCQQAELQRYFD